mmetsp:Transcript_56133/g.135567  ORF Transcript_56133/g.135567 Transcript_56133/m.135567 type:complete len:216 (+) Transcript_56133:355-1002(+)
MFAPVVCTHWRWLRTVAWSPAAVTEPCLSSVAAGASGWTRASSRWQVPSRASTAAPTARRCSAAHRRASSTACASVAAALSPRCSWPRTTLTRVLRWARAQAPAPAPRALLCPTVALRSPRPPLWEASCPSRTRPTSATSSPPCRRTTPCASGTRPITRCPSRRSSRMAATRRPLPTRWTRCSPVGRMDSCGATTLTRGSTCGQLRTRTVAASPL